METVTFTESKTNHSMYTFPLFDRCYPRSPRQQVPYVYDKVYGIGPIFVWNQANSLAVQLKYPLYQVEYFAKCKVIVPYLGFVVFLPMRSWNPRSADVRRAKRIGPTICPLAVIWGQRNCERDPIIQHNTTQPCGI